MVTIGADLHKRWHTAVAVDEQGRKLAERTVRATPAGHLELLRLGRAGGPSAAGRWRTAGTSRGASRRDLRARRRVGRAGARPSSWPGARRSAREPGKSDPIDALAVARAALREPDLPIARLDGPEREVRLLVDHRDDLVAERTRAQNRLRWHLHELMPGRRARGPLASTGDHVLGGARGRASPGVRAPSPASPPSWSAASGS